ncbi:hypothetical protein NFI96_007124, partial [Prochilodus magdalenae]
NHTAVGRALEALEQTNQKKYPSHDSLLHGYLHFEALTAHDYNFSCVNCGDHPPVVILDLHKKGVFSMPVSDVKDPPPEFDGHVDIEEFWQSVAQEIVCRGFVKSNRENLFAITPAYDKWAPWIGPRTRASKTVINTEYAKMNAKKSSVEQAEVEITEERLSSDLMNLKVEALRKLVKECGLDSKGSKMDLLLRLRAEMKTRSTYDKVFQKVWGASGGWAVIMCPCGIVNAVKFNIRAESPRDYADMLLSYKHFPNVVVYDFARGLATHTNLREPEKLPFSPFEGRLAAATPENITSAKQGNLKVNLPWLNMKKDPPDDNGHPATGAAEHYALYDTFHQYNTKEEKDVLRQIGHVPQLCGWLNSQTAEQLFSGMRKNNYFMNSLSPTSHIFLMRCILHHHNEKKNLQALEDLKQVSFGTISLDSSGKAILGTSSPIKKPMELPSHKMQEAEDSTYQCGQQCAAATAISNLRPWRNSWTLSGDHPLQEELINYILDEQRPMNEIIVKDGQTCLTRENFLTLGLRQEMDSVIGDACMRLVKEMIQLQGKEIFIMDPHIPPTWLSPLCCDPLISLPVDSHNKDVLIFPLWTPGHYLLCGLPKQTSGNDCGIFMIMYSWYVAMEARFDFTINDMPYLRRFWCKILVENLQIVGHGRKFAHFTEQGKKTMSGNLQTVFRISRKRRQEEVTTPCSANKMLFRVIISQQDIRKLKLDSVPDSIDGLKLILRSKLQLTDSFDLLYEDEDFHDFCHLTCIALRVLFSPCIDKFSDFSFDTASWSVSSPTSSSASSHSQSSSAHSQLGPACVNVPSFLYDVKLRLSQANEFYRKDGVLLTISRDMKSEILDKLAEAIYSYKAYPENKEFESVAIALVENTLV